jgi:2-oxoglutarate ferredoxin oxidoreductase subunit beta
MSTQEPFQTRPTAWCPGCGNHAILKAAQKALREMNIASENVLLVGGIGQASKLPQYLEANNICTLHGRALPAATGARLANQALTVLAFCGDGDCYGEGGNHLVHAVRRNVDITVIVHNNQVYGLTKGQASPSSDPGFITKAQPGGVIAGRLDGPGLAISLGCDFVARGFTGLPNHLEAIIKTGVLHRGFSFIEVLQPCVSMNKVNTFAWYKSRVYDVQEEGSHDPGDRTAAFSRTREWGDRIPVGILYQQGGRSQGDRLPLLSGMTLATMPVRDLEQTRSLFEDFI